ncbi:DUF309 domain-containing protein [Paenibacillus thermotolerans]|uniref:DUF309 domain-containing protein n=1 Tax=Paenibacillus thermotolerans TaxID=3027807 RepID=UPI002367FAF3|nr:MULTISPECIES: DUF309 domain-containing protein [unclassified Paenibacillus]
MTSRYPQAYIDFLVRFHGDRDFFECHELLEDYWKEHPECPFRQVWVGLIQAAVGLYHQRRGNFRGAVKSFAGSIRNSDPALLRELGIDADDWLKRLAERRALLLTDSCVLYEDLDIPLQEEALFERCRSRADELGLHWGSPSDMQRRELIHRHMLRDRSDVIEKRRKALETRLGG